MNFFGFTIEKIQPEELATQSNAHAKMGIGLPGYEPMPSIINNFKNPYWDAIQWPSRNRLDGFERVKYDRLLMRFIKNLESGVGAYLDICLVDDLSQLGCFKITHQTRPLYEKLRMVHCVKYVNVPPDILLQIPGLLNAIFTEGESLNQKDVSNLSGHQWSVAALTNPF